MALLMANGVRSAAGRRDISRLSASRATTSLRFAGGPWTESWGWTSTDMQGESYGPAEFEARALIFEFVATDPRQPPLDMDYTIERALVVHAHPDDMEFTAGGTVAKWSDAGIEVNLVICTEGNRGGEGERTEDELVEVRRVEQA